ncbi:uncharacterized protein [Linepithema humile]|uniref:uncharacterized protein n=1 Tax=Linepithema humile TaxID=83485 RepID=UPI0006237FDA|nr:PREDICTED: uncharacterized protein LOC105674197 [Linepithema humile]
MPPAITFCLLILTLTAAKNTIDMYKRSYTTESENLRIILNYIRSKQEYYPMIFALVSSDAQSKFTDFLSKYMASESIVSYKITTSDFSQKYTWQNRVDLTWIFIVDSIDILNSLVYEQSHIWKATNQYLAIIATPNAAISPREIFQTIWRNYNVHRIIVISIRDDFRCLSRYLPFDKNQRDEYGIVRKICLMNQESNVELYDNLRNLNGYPIKVIVFQSLMMDVALDESTGKYRYDKLDARAMSLLEKTMSAEFRINVLTNFTHNADPFHNSLRYIENGESEMIITSFFIHKYEYRKYEFTASVYEDKLCLIAPTTGFVPKSYMPIMPFAVDLWLALAVYNVLMSILWFLVKYYSESFRQQEAILLPLMRTPVLAQRTDSSPRTHPHVSSCFHLVETSCYPLQEDGGSGTTAQRVLLFGTLFFGLIIINLYQSILVSTLSDPPHYPELDTLEDVANSNFTIITKYRNLREHTFKGNSTLDNKLHSKCEVIVSKRPTNDMVAFGPEKVIAISRYASFMLDNMSSYYDADGNDLLHIIDECPTTYLLSYVMRLYSPYRERIDWLLLRMQEAGLVKMWYDDMVYPMHVAEQKRKMDKSERRIKLTMEHYSLTFAGLSIGLLSCSIIFLAELYFAKRSQSRR